MSRSVDRQAHLRHLITHSEGHIERWAAFNLRMERRRDDGTFYDVKKAEIAYHRGLIAQYQQQLEQEILAAVA